MLHDPQPAGLAAVLAGAGARVIWRCHVGCDAPNEWTRRAWDFLRPYLDGVESFVVSRATFAPPWADPNHVAVVPPSIDPFSAKNQPMSRRTVRMTLGYVGLPRGRRSDPRCAVCTTRRITWTHQSARRHSPDRAAAAAGCPARRAGLALGPA